MECGDGKDTWGYGEYTFDLMRQYLAGGARSFMQWNMVLDQTSKSSWGWAQNAMVTVHKDTKAVAYNPQFYAVKHFSYYVKPRAFLVQTGGGDADAIAFRNPDGSLVLVVKNGGAQDAPLTVTLNRTRNQADPARALDQHVRSKGLKEAASDACSSPAGEVASLSELEGVLRTAKLQKCLSGATIRHLPEKEVPTWQPCL